MSTFVHAQLSASLYCQQLASDLVSTNKYSFAEVQNADGAILYTKSNDTVPGESVLKQVRSVFQLSGWHGSARVAFCDDVHGQCCALKCTVIVLFELSRSASRSRHQQPFGAYDCHSVLC